MIIERVDHMNILIGTYTKENSQGIYNLKIDKKLNYKLNLLYKTNNPSYLDYKNNYLFTISSSDKGGIKVFKDNKLVDELHIENKTPSHISYSSYHNLIMTSNYQEGKVTIYKFNDNKISFNQEIFYENGSHAHQMVYYKETDKFYVCDLGLDLIYIYEINNDLKLNEIKRISFPKKSGPRHLILNANNNLIYLLCELSSEIYLIDPNNYEIINKYKTIPNNLKHNNQTAAIRLSNDNKFLYVSNRGEDTIALFKINKNELIYINSFKTNGTHPRDFNISLDNKYLLVANLHSNNLTLFERDIKKGDISFIKEISCFEPTNILFID